jgi:glycosyltransferase involved in cell wall biosynthesis
MRKFKISILASVVYRNDAISNTVIHNYLFISKLLAKLGLSFEVRIFAASHDSGIADNIYQIPNVQSLIADDFFMQSDLVLAHFGIYHSIFDSLFLVSRRAKVIFYYHGVTPAAYSEQPLRGVLEGSMIQQTLAIDADLILTNSKTIARTLEPINQRKIDIEPIGLPVKFISENVDNKNLIVSTSDLRMLYVGRIVKQKGVHLILKAIRVLEDKGFRATMIFAFSPKHSDGELIKEIQHEQDRCRFIKIKIMENLKDSDLEKVFKFSNLLLFPSEHEGFGLPVIEGLANGCQCIISKNGALPEITGGLAISLPYLNELSLIQSIIKFNEVKRNKNILSDSGIYDQNEWLKKVKSMIAYHFIDAYEARLEAAFLPLLSSFVSEPFSNGEEAFFRHKKSVYRNLISYEISELKKSNYLNFAEKLLQDADARVPKFSEHDHRILSAFRALTYGVGVAEKKILVEDLIVESAASLSKKQILELAALMKGGHINEDGIIKTFTYATTVGELDLLSYEQENGSEAEMIKKGFQSSLHHMIEKSILNLTFM